MIGGALGLALAGVSLRLLRSALPNSSLLVYEQVGHALHWEQPQRFANDLADFVARLGATDASQPTSLFA